MAVMRDVRAALRLIGVLRTLARHRALDWLLAPGRLSGPRRLALKLALLASGRRRDLDPDPDARLVAALQELGPAYVKLGQMLATRPDIIGARLAERLSQLQDRMPPFAGAAAVVAEELGRPIDELFAEFDDEPVAAASIAQVHRARDADGRVWAVKVLRPGIEEAFRRDLEAFRVAARHLERHVPMSRRLRPREVVETVARTVADELDLTMEAAAADELRENMAGLRGYAVPAVDWRRTGRRVLTMEWVEGVPLTDRATLAAAGHDGGRLAATLVGAFLLQALRDGFFHADLHQGNFLVRADGTVVALDFGIMGRLDAKSRRYLAEILYGFQQRDWMRIARWHFSAGYVPKGQDVRRFAQAMRAIAEPIFDRPVREISAGRLLARLFATTERFGMPTQPQLLLLQRSMVMVEGLALHLDPEANMWALSRPVIEAFVREELAPEVELADRLRAAFDALLALPRLLARLEERLDTPEAAPPASAPDGAPGV
ncbi:MAG: putative protein kinase UbiB [Rhodothalassiaceae bacterium]|nr:MAG: putative protein kinase UbiB [Rhodothalassiaceae bacterium]